MSFADGQHLAVSLAGFTGTAYIAFRVLGAICGWFGKVRRIGQHTRLQGRSAKHDWGGFWP